QVENFKEMVHEGTYMLIFSILLSMTIILYFFRNNLNFYPKNIWLKRFAYIWIFQNSIMVISVALRTYYYIEQMGLAYKRIGVFIFLLLTLVGLYTLYQKISTQKSIYYLFRVNTWAVYLVLIVMGTIDWDTQIVKHNLIHYRKVQQIGVNFMVSRAVKTLPLIHQNRHQINPDGSWAEVPWYKDKEWLIDGRIRTFLAEQANYSWLSWNYADYKSKKYFTNVMHYPAHP
ncbi:MAG: DUF4173 domain-containing protein, partial [Bacteroidia bacterium]|nr:DUF4173 domain-containing protein [Bacteroidia bacterium]